MTASISSIRFPFSKPLDTYMQTSFPGSVPTRRSSANWYLVETHKTALMMELGLRMVAIAVWSAFALRAAAAATPLQSAACDRACLEGHVSEYLTSLAAHDPSRLATTPNIKYVENDQFLPLGSGLWAIASSPGKYRHVFADPEAGQVSAITTINENGVAVIYILRLKVQSDGKISEIETHITRDSVGAARYEKLGQPEDVWLQAVPPAQRISRAALVAGTDKYYRGMERNSPKGDYSFFDKNCSRIEDGLQTVNVKTGEAYGHSNDTVFASLTATFGILREAK